MFLARQAREGEKTMTLTKMYLIVEGKREGEKRFYPLLANEAPIDVGYLGNVQLLVASIRGVIYVLRLLARLLSFV